MKTQAPYRLAALDCCSLLMLTVTDTVLAAVVTLYRYDADAVLVMDQRRQKPLGVFTPRDLVSVIARGFNPQDLSLGEWLHAVQLADTEDRASENWVG